MYLYNSNNCYLVRYSADVCISDELAHQIKGCKPVYLVTMKEFLPIVNDALTDYDNIRVLQSYLSLSLGS